jgi:hypothetical protein
MTQTKRVINRHLLIGRKTERIVLTKKESEQTLPISKRNLAENPTIKGPTIKRTKEKSLLANIAEEPRVNNEERIRIIHTTNVVSKTVTRLQRMSNIPTWARLQARTRIINPRVM